MANINLYRLIFGFMRLGQFLLTVSKENDSHMSNMDYNYLQRHKRNINALNFKEQDVAKTSKFTLEDYYYSIPLIFEDDRSTRSALHHKINIIPIKEDNIVRKIDIINNKVFFGTPGIVTDISVFVSWNLLKLNVGIDKDNVSRFSYFINIIIDALIELEANDESILKDSQIYKLEEILTNIFTKCILNDSNVFEFSKFVPQSELVWDSYKRNLDSDLVFSMPMDNQNLQYFINQIIDAVS